MWKIRASLLVVPSGGIRFHEANTIAQEQEKNSSSSHSLDGHTFQIMATRPERVRKKIITVTLEEVELCPSFPSMLIQWELWTGGFLRFASSLSVPTSVFLVSARRQLLFHSSPATEPLISLSQQKGLPPGAHVHKGECEWQG